MRCRLTDTSTRWLNRGSFDRPKSYATGYPIDHGVVTDYAPDPDPSGPTVRTAMAGCATFLIHILGLYKELDALAKIIKVWNALNETDLRKGFTHTFFPEKSELPFIGIGGIVRGIGREHGFFRFPRVRPRSAWWPSG